MNKYISFLLLIGFLMIFDNLQGQDTSIQVIDTTIEEITKTETPKYISNSTLVSQAKRQLKNGVLIVLLKTNAKRIQQLEILSRSSEYSEKQKQNVLLKIAAIKKETLLKNQALIEGFNREYRFSEVYFAFDTSLTSIQKGIKKGIFVNDNLSIDKSISIETNHIYFCRYGLVSTSQEKEGLVITDINNKKIPRPFPSVSVSGASGFLLILNLITNDEEYAKKSIARDIRKLEESLQNLKVNDRK